MSMFVRRLRPTDGDDLAELYRSPEVIEQTGQLPDRGAAFWLGFYTARDPNAVDLVAELDGKVIGHLGILTNVNPRRKHVASFGVAVNPAFQGRGAGKALIREMIALCDNWLNIVRLELTVFTDNPRAIGLYEACGFVREGVARADMFKNGRFVDGLHMARFNPAYRGMLEG